MKEPGSTPAEADLVAELKRALRAASASFRKKSFRHRLRSRDVIYCAFSTPKFSVRRDEAQRDAAQRLRRFGIEAEQISGKRLLDLGCNNGAMLFELSNFAPAFGLGIEYDADKVDLARRIARFAGLEQLEFRVGDIDTLQPGELGEPFDVVLCLAIEAHVQQPGRLYELLGRITRDRLYFEANSSTPPAEVIRQLERAGFAEIEYLGVCDDDIVPRNNRRPLFRARMGRPV